MDNYLYLIGGILIILLVFIDFGVTVFVPKGAGFLTQSVTTVSAKFFKLISGNIGRTKILEYKPLFIILGMIMVWILGFWLGFTLIYASDIDSVVHSQTKEISSFVQKFYFVGYTLSTLGQGDFVPVEVSWQVFTSFISFTGFGIITICITYIVPVIHSFIDKATLTLQIASLGQSPFAILKKGYNGTDFEELTNEFPLLASLIFKHAKNHDAYPILHHVHNSDANENTILKLVVLDEACTILLYHIPKEKCKHRNKLLQLRSSLTYYLKTVRNVPVPDHQPPPPVNEKTSEGFDFTFINDSETEIKLIYSKLEHRRKLCKGLIEDDGFSWQDISEKNAPTLMEWDYEPEE